MSKYVIAQPTITVDQRGMLIPLETLDVTGTGIAVIALAHGLGLKVGAEGVENERQAGFLRAQQCDQTQGYLLRVPRAPDALVDWMRARRSRSLRRLKRRLTPQQRRPKSPPLRRLRPLLHRLSEPSRRLGTAPRS